MRHLIWLTAAAACGCAGSASFSTVPPKAIDLNDLSAKNDDRRMRTDPGVQAKLDRKPLAKFPATLAIVRVQSSGWRNTTSQGWGEGNYSVVFARDVERQEHFDRIAKLPMVQAVAPVNRLLLSRKLENDEQLRAAAAAVQADLLLLYTVDTLQEAHSRVPGADALSLGLLPLEEARCAVTASFVLMDTRNGYIYGAGESSVRKAEPATAWVMDRALENVRTATETEAFGKLVEEFERTWAHVVAHYARTASNP